MQIGSTVNNLMIDMVQMPMERFRQITEKFGFNYGPTFSIIKQIWQRDNEGLCLVDISESPTIQTEAEVYVVHPSILDACLQSCFIAIENLDADDASIVPVGFKSITLNEVPSTNQLYCHATATNFGKFDVRLMSPSGKVLLTMGDFRYAELTSTQREYGFDELTYDVQWKEDDLHDKRETAPHLTCLLLKDSSGFSDALIRRLEQAKVNVITLDQPNTGGFNSKVKEAIMAAISDIPPSNPTNLRVINMWPVATTVLPDDFSVIDEVQSLALHSSVFLVKLVVEKEWSDCRLFLVTERTQMLDGSNKSAAKNSIPWCSTIWGFRRTVGLEEPNLRVTAVDLDNKRDKHQVDLLVDEILNDSNEEEVVFREAKRFVNRLMRSKISPEQPSTNAIEGKKTSSWYLSFIPSSRTVCLREKSLSKPSHSEVTIDLLHCWTPSESLIDVCRPNRCVFVVGKVTDLPGKSQHTFKIGDEVCGVMPSGRVSRTVTVQVSNVFLKPTRLTGEQATYIPACLALASYALQRVASEKENQKLLIHEANRGPGPAAVVLAKALGHVVFCTISDTCQTTTETTLLDMGAESVKHQSFPGLSYDFSHVFDAVIFFYPPSPNALHKSSRGLKRGGRVIILTSDFHGNVVFTANTNVRYEKEDAVDILRSPHVYQKLSLQSLELLEGRGVLKDILSMQMVSTDLEAGIEASNACLVDKSSHEIEASSSTYFRIHSFVSSEKGSSFGKVAVLPRGLDECGLKENRTYLVAGGIRGYGFEVACWMAENGAKCIGLIGRSKPSDAKCQEVRELERRTGTKIHIFQVIDIQL